MTVVSCNAGVALGKQKAFTQRADWIAVNTTAKLDFLFSLTAITGGFVAVCHLC